MDRKERHERYVCSNAMRRRAKKMVPPVNGVADAAVRVFNRNGIAVQGVLSMIFLSILFILIGLAMIFARDFMWGLTERSNQMAGRTSERTEMWDTGQIISGVILALLGGGFLCWQISE